MTRYTLHVPEQDNDGAAVPAELIQDIQRELVEIGGGFTLTRATGAWRGEDGRIYHEPVSLYTVDTDELLAHPLLELLALRIARELEQEAVYLTRAEITAQLITPARV